MKSKSGIATTIMLLASASQTAQADDGIVTDRPDFVESSETVGAHRFQLEAGVERDTGDEDGNAWLTPTLLRYGIADNWEVRLESDGYSRVDSGTRQVSGWNDIALGVKYHVADSGSNGAPSMAWLFHVDLPTGARDIGGHGARPSLRWVAEWELPDDFSIGAMPGVIYDSTDDGHRFAAGIAGVTFGKDFGERAHAFVELAAPQIAASRNGGTQASFDTGGSYKLDADTQIDAAVFLGLNSRTPDAAVGIGISKRW